MEKKVKVFDVLKFAKEIGEADYSNINNLAEASLVVHKFLEEGEVFIGLHGESLPKESIELLNQLVDVGSLGYLLPNAFVNYEVESKLSFEDLYMKSLSLLSPYFKMYADKSSSTKVMYKGNERIMILTSRFIIYLDENYAPLSYLDVDYDKHIIHIIVYNSKNKEEMSELMENMATNGLEDLIALKETIESTFSRFLSGDMSDEEFDEMVKEPEDPKAMN